MKSSLSKLIPDSINCYNIKRDAYNNDGILVLTAEQIQRCSKMEQELIKIIGERFYGQHRD
jgi:hypothetical protein